MSPKAVAGKPFSEMNLFDDKDTEVLLYAMLSANNDEVFSFEAFQKLIKNKKHKKELLRKVSEVFSVIRQFDSSKEIQKAENSGNVENVSISDIAALLIVRGGVSANYVMSEMDLYEMNALMKAIEEEKRQNMEEKRLWTYLSILPHIDGKKIKSANDFYSFPWEVEEDKASAEKDIELNADKLEAFLNSGKKQ